MIDKRNREIKIGCDGQLWTWTENGQHTVASSGSYAADFIAKNFEPLDAGMTRLLSYQRALNRGLLKR